MRVRLWMDPNKVWWVQSKCWWQFKWHNEACFIHDDAYERAHFYARALKFQHTEEII